jgi:hypothetical protein
MRMLSDYSWVSCAGAERDAAPAAVVTPAGHMLAALTEPLEALAARHRDALDRAAHQRADRRVLADRRAVDDDQLTAQQRATDVQLKQIFDSVASIFGLFDDVVLQTQKTSEEHGLFTAARTGLEGDQDAFDRDAARLADVSARVKAESDAAAEAQRAAAAAASAAAADQQQLQTEQEVLLRRQADGRLERERLFEEQRVVDQHVTLLGGGRGRRVLADASPDTSASSAQPFASGRDWGALQSRDHNVAARPKQPHQQQHHHDPHGRGATGDSSSSVLPRSISATPPSDDRRRLHPEHDAGRTAAQAAMQVAAAPSALSMSTAMIVSAAGQRSVNYDADASDAVRAGGNRGAATVSFADEEDEL